jgi:hypothetical protein
LYNFYDTYPNGSLSLLSAKFGPLEGVGSDVQHARILRRHVSWTAHKGAKLVRVDLITCAERACRHWRYQTLPTSEYSGRTTITFDTSLDTQPLLFLEGKK